MVYYLGIDESNHGRFPEIHVGVFSNHRPDWRKGEYCKSRKKSMPINGALRENNLERDYRHVLTPKDHTKIFSKDQLALISITELVWFFSEESFMLDDDGIEKVLIDGDKDPRGRDKLKEMIYPLTPKIEFVPGGDRKYRIINLADMAAYQLFRNYTSSNPDVEDRFKDSLLTPRLEDYADFFREDRKFY